MADSTSDNQGWVFDNSSEEALKIDEQTGVTKSPIEEVWEAVPHSTDELDKVPD